MRTLFAMILAASACGYEFETEKDRFRCASDDDCVDGFVCAGHSVVDGKPVTTCVASADAEVAIWQETMPAFQSGCTSHVWEFDWDAWMVVSPNATPPEPTLPPDAVDRQAFVADGGTCSGEVSGYGEMRIMCRMPSAGVDAKSAGMWVMLYEPGGDAFDTLDRVALAFTSAQVDAETRMAPAPDDIDRHHQFDRDRTGPARCALAVGRLCPENQASANCAGCTADEQCPMHFSCDLLACKPSP